MNVKNLACTLLVLAGMVSCTAESDAPVNNENAEVTISLEKTFNARSIDYTEANKKTLDLSELPPMSIEEAESILKTIRNRQCSSTTHSLETQNGEGCQKLLTVSAECNVDNQHKFTIELSLINYEDDGSLYYKDYKAIASSSLYKWHMNGFGLATDGKEGMYKFDCVSYLYFKIVDKGISYYQIPVQVKGKYDPSTHAMNFTYSL